MTPLDIHIRTKADTGGAKDAASSLQDVTRAAAQSSGEFKGFTDEQKAHARELVRGIEAKEKSAAATRNLGRDVRSATGAFSGLRNIVGGAFNGNLLQVAQGFGQISNAVVGASKNVQTFFTQAARGGAIGAGIAAPVVVAIGLMRKEAADAEKDMQRMWAEADASRAQYQAGLQEVAAAAAASLKEQETRVEALAAAYRELIGLMDSAAQRVGQLRDAEQDAELAGIDRAEAEALAKATTTEQRDAIRAKAEGQRAGVKDKYGAAAAESELLNADNRERAAQDKIQAASAEQFEADQRVAAARVEADNLRDGITGLGSDTSPAAQSARAKARLAADNLAAAERNAQAIRERNAPTIAQANDEITAAQQTRELSGPRSQAARARSIASGLNRNLRPVGNATKVDPLAGLRDQQRFLQSELANADPGSTRARSAAANLESVSSDMKREYGRLSVAAKEIADTFTKTAKDVSKTAQQVKNTRESSGGGN